nr:patatin-like phospholipase family protein [Kitasatospora fiedleri]
MVRPGNVLRGRPVVDLHNLVEHLYAHVARMDFDAILANPTTLHPIATHTGTGVATDLHPLLTDPARLRLALRASAALPLLAGPPVELDGSRYYDAGLAESIPFRTALAQGATHVLVLRSRARSRRRRRRLRRRRWRPGPRAAPGWSPGRCCAATPRRCATPTWGGPNGCSPTRSCSAATTSPRPPTAPPCSPSAPGRRPRRSDG